MEIKIKLESMETTKDKEYYKEKEIQEAEKRVREAEKKVREAEVEFRKRTAALAAARREEEEKWITLLTLAEKKAKEILVNTIKKYKKYEGGVFLKLKVFEIFSNNIIMSPPLFLFLFLFEREEEEKKDLLSFLQIEKKIISYEYPDIPFRDLTNISATLKIKGGKPPKIKVKIEGEGGPILLFFPLP